MEDLKSNLTKALFLEKKEESTTKQSENKTTSSNIKQSKLGDAKRKLALSDLQNQNYIDSTSTSAESSEAEVEKGIVQMRRELLKTKNAELKRMVTNSIVEDLSVTNETDSEGEIGLGIPFSILRLPVVTKRRRSRRGRKMMAEVNHSERKMKSSFNEVARTARLKELLYLSNSYTVVALLTRIPT
ncbi:hypothetical protein BSL78_22262 [Apostichopus japonicus]|uniref:Uncharacterized protein n=1 Tax=Stichopus japonicus TaxID=307972 RepID=A0A2G8JYU0_STIJA|nr:hypothetical protein BSL78_22262 [Apostichopus japonicus]